MADETTPPKPNASGGCSIGCAGLFVFAGLAWPVLHFVGGHVEPEAMFIPIVIGGPAFLVAHILAIMAMRSCAAETAARTGSQKEWPRSAGMIYDPETPTKLPTKSNQGMNRFVDRS